MVLKLTAWFFILVVTIHKTNGCCDEEDQKNFAQMDLNSNGFVSKDEFFTYIQNQTLAELEWANFNFTTDQGPKCQDFIVRSVSGIAMLQDDNPFKMVLAQKAECCEEIDADEVLEILKFHYIEKRLESMDKDKNNVTSCAEVIDEIAEFSLFIVAKRQVQMEQEMFEEILRRLELEEMKNNFTMSTMTQ